MGAGDDAAAATLTDLPAVHELAATLTATHASTDAGGPPHTLAVAAARRAIAEHREALLSGKRPGTGIERRAEQLLAELSQPSLRRVINATGVILHTNLGRAPLARPAREALATTAAGYSNLELDLATGERGSRQAHVETLLRELTGAEAAMAVNNGAAAVLLAAATLAGGGRAIAVSRGQLVEIGGGFRIPEVIAASGATLLEVGTTNRTRLLDFERALAAPEREVAAIMRVHPSNFRSLGFVEEVGIEALCSLGVPVIDDAGSGVLAPEAELAAVAGEPALRRSVAAGASLVCCSGDKLLGGPQAGLLVGRRSSIAAARSHPLARALRIDKLSLAALEATLMLYRDPVLALREIPALAMLALPEEVLAARVERLCAGIGPAAVPIRATARPGGGALPLLELDGPAVALDAPDGDPAELARQLRTAAATPVIARVHDGRVVLNPRTLAEEGEIDEVVAAARAILAG